jgi:RimJ/RimL family protein N-acetyltransferase
VTNELVGWRNAAVMAGHWALHGAGMFVVEEKASGRFVGRVGPWFPPGWPGFEVGWGIASDFRGKGYAVEAARAAIDWVFATFELDRIIHCIDHENTASQAVARRLGAEKQGETDLFGHAADVWVTKRSSWMA